MIKYLVGEFGFNEMGGFSYYTQALSAAKEASSRDENYGRPIIVYDELTEHIFAIGLNGDLFDAN